MADLSDVTAYLASAVAPFVYPNGASSPSIAPVPPNTPTQTFTQPMDVRIYEGWPVSDQLDLDLAGKVLRKNPDGTSTAILRPNGPCANVSVFPMLGASYTPYQIQDHTYTVVPPAINLTVTASGQPGAGNTQLTVTGTPANGEYVTVDADRQFTFSATGTTASAILTALLAQAQVQYPSASLSGSILSIPASYSFEVRQGGVGVLGKATHRECQMIMITVWAPDHNTRSVLSKAIDGGLKQNIVVTLSDNTQAKITYARTRQSDDSQNVSLYRRDMIFEVEYATLQTFPGYVVTSVNVAVDGGNHAIGPAPETTVI